MNLNNTNFKIASNFETLKNAKWIQHPYIPNKYIKQHTNEWYLLLNHQIADPLTRISLFKPTADLQSLFADKIFGSGENVSNKNLMFA